MSESYWNNVKTGAKILYAYGDTSSQNSRNSQEKSVSIWQDEPTNEENLANLQAKKERCDSKWNEVKNFFGFGHFERDIFKNLYLFIFTNVLII